MEVLSFSVMACGRLVFLDLQVADFGLSVAMDNKTHASHMFSGTPFYIAPETQVGWEHVCMLWLKATCMPVRVCVLCVPFSVMWAICGIAEGSE